MVTDKQRWRLVNEGYNPDAIDKMSFEQASEIIGKLPVYKKEVKQPQIESFIKPQGATSYKKPFDTSSYYVAYAKDLCIAVIEAIGRKDPKREIEIDKIMETAVFCIKQAKSEFEK